MDSCRTCLCSIVEILALSIPAADIIVVFMDGNNGHILDEVHLSLPVYSLVTLFHLVLPQIIMLSSSSCL